MAARRKAKKPKGRARAAKPRKRAGTPRPRARKTSRPPAAREAVSQRVSDLEAENRRLRDEIATLRSRLTQQTAPPAESAEPVEPDEELPLG